jgi:hypothetical protein
MKHEQRIYTTAYCENCLSYILSYTLASSVPGHRAMTVTNGLYSFAADISTNGKEDAVLVDVLTEDLIHISIHIEASVFRLSI